MVSKSPKSCDFGLLLYGVVEVRYNKCVLKNTTTMRITFEDGNTVDITVKAMRFDEWKGLTIADNYNGKSVLDYEGKPVFAELLVLRMLEKEGWTGVWVDSYRKKFRVGLPELAKPVDLPDVQNKIFEDLGGFKDGGCWDVFAWKGANVQFVECKRLGRDKTRDSQIDWLKKATDSGISTGAFVIYEWTTD